MIQSTSALQLRWTHTAFSSDDNGLELSTGTTFRSSPFAWPTSRCIEELSSPSCNRAFTFTTGDHYLSCTGSGRTSAAHAILQHQSARRQGRNFNCCAVGRTVTTPPVNNWWNWSTTRCAPLPAAPFANTPEALYATDLAHEALIRLLGEQAIRKLTATSTT